MRPRGDMANRQRHQRHAQFFATALDEHVTAFAVDERIVLTHFVVETLSQEEEYWVLRSSSREG